MPKRDVGATILETLKDLGKEDFSDFCDQLTDPGEKRRIRRSEVEGKSRSEVAKLLVKRCEEVAAPDRTLRALRGIGCNNEARTLESKYKSQLLKKPPCVSEPDPAPTSLSDRANSDPKITQKVKQVTLDVDNSLKSSPAPSEPRIAMSAKAILRRNKTSVQNILSADPKLILNKVYENNLITEREYNNLKGIHKETVEGHVIELVDTVMNKGDERCQRFIDLLETDEDIKETFPNLNSIQLSLCRPLPAPVQETCEMDNTDVEDPSCKKTKVESYSVTSNPKGICLIVNNKNFSNNLGTRNGTEIDTESLGEVFSWLGFKVLMCEDKTQRQMTDVLNCFSTLSDTSKLQQWGLKEWSQSKGFDVLQNSTALKHGDVFICCVLSHGNAGVVYGTHGGTLAIKDITRTFKTSDNSPLNGKPKMFFIQACQGGKVMPGVTVEDLDTDSGPTVTVPEAADILVHVSSVEDYLSARSQSTGTWFIQSLCKQLKEGCSRSDEIESILRRVNSEVSQKSGHFGRTQETLKQMPEIRHTLTKKLSLLPVNDWN